MSKFIVTMLTIASTGALLTPPIHAAEAEIAANQTKPIVAPNKETIEEVVDVAPVWAGHQVGFALFTRGDQQFAAFYDAERNLTVGQRKLGEKSFRLTRLDTKVGWDSHNYIAMSADDEGFLHVSGNMHGVPLIYFRSTKPLDASSLERVPHMTGALEEHVTYPRFFRGPGGEFLFTYRDGGSGNGNQIYNRYDVKTRSWKRLLDQPLFDGEGQRNAYPSVPTLGPDGFYHIVWVWRETPDAATNHDPSYARSRDLVHWETSQGKALQLPITLATGDVIDPVPEKGGVINGNVKIGFDAQKRVVISYHKYDAQGNTQIYNARPEGGKWALRQASDWHTRWDFGGGGTLVFEVGLGNVQADSNGTLTQTYMNKREGSGNWILDPQTLKPTGLKPSVAGYPASLAKAEAKTPEMGVRWEGDGGRKKPGETRYVLRWETLPSNRDQPRTGDLPAPSMLRVYQLRNSD